MAHSVWGVCFKADDDLCNGRTVSYYETVLILVDLEALNKEHWQTIRVGLLVDYGTIVTSNLLVHVPQS